MSQSPSVVITGLGLWTALGNREATWGGICAGRSATRFLPELGYIGAPAEVPPGIEPVISLAQRAAREALTHAAIEVDPQTRWGIVFGTSKGGLHTFDRLRRAASADAHEFLNCFVDAPSRHLAEYYDIRGPVLAPVAACATGLVCAIRAAQLIEEGACDAVITGSSDASLLPILLASYRRLGVLSQGRDEPARACRPFDRTRSGFVVGEGAGALIFERADFAQRRGAKILAHWRGGAVGSDPDDLTRLASSPQSLVRLIKDVLRQSDRTAADVGYINLHGTGTQQNDLYESRAILSVFANKHVPHCSGQKGALGHLMGAAGSVELALTVLALSRGTLPPTTNLREIDPQCPLDHIRDASRNVAVETAMKLSLGFGGHLAAAVLSRAE